ncbi:quinol monooxygenase YgiN [Dyadobacter jejuensis]|uniref:Quinol monooxygenase YgiN n=1 Tax=Dyadobacter jejuensis TaxID=1082580 RepID=A0A316ASK4_9BACT|nr:antibiotic biosynthesis monooxygenase family protein [Dyadobacter jejuensis]PWJ60431.1 quinol monooxygenase YgiN [Dyadobacter jejuensis]
MLIRIVRMYFRPEEVEAFKRLFEASRTTIASTPGCLHLALWQDLHDPSIMVTYSHWDTEASLDAYRHSPFFEQVWGDTKRLFRDKPMAFSVKEA